MVDEIMSKEKIHKNQRRHSKAFLDQETGTPHISQHARQLALGLTATIIFFV
jgi:hypothetical protein